MRENCTTLYPNEEVALKVSDYSDRHSLDLPDAVTKYHEWVLQTQERSYFTISMLEARYLTWMTRLMGAKRGKYSAVVGIVSKRLNSPSPGDWFLCRLLSRHVGERCWP